MSRRSFALRPFESSSAPARYQLGGDAERAGPWLDVAWRLRGDLDALSLPAPAPAPERRDGLWRATCFELFLGVAGAPGYLELNLAPSGHWNAYRFDGYRAGMRPELALAALPFVVTRGVDRLDLGLRLALAPLGLDAADLEAGLSAVLAGPGGAVSHWALHHPGPAPDFHARAAFRLRLPAADPA